jgi:hypothetical protein
MNQQGSSNSGDGHYEVYWPRAARRIKGKPLARRLDTLNGKTIAQFWDFIFSGDKVFEALEEGIRKRFPDVRFVSWREFGNTHGQNERKILEDLPANFKRLGVDAAISGMGC